MNESLQIHAIKTFEYAFLLLEEKSNIGVQSIQTRELLIRQFKERDNTTDVSDHLNQIEGLEKDETLLAMQIIPGIVLLSLCIELVLKLRIKLSDNADIKGHDLNKLFGMLQSKEKKLITQEVIKELNISEAEFGNLLEKNANGFVSWRYFYEKANSSNLQFLRSLFGSIKHLVPYM